MASKESTTFKGIPRYQSKQWIQHELNFFPGVKQLDQLLFPVNFAQLPDYVVTQAYDPDSHELLDDTTKPFGDTNSARFSRVQIIMGSGKFYHYLNYDPQRSISFYPSTPEDNLAGVKSKPAEVIQTGILQNGTTLVTKSSIDIDASQDTTPKGTTKLQTILLASENESEVVRIKLRRDPEKNQIWYDLSELKEIDKKKLNLHLHKEDSEGGEDILWVSATIGKKNIILPIPKSVIPDEKFVRKNIQPAS